LENNIYAQVAMVMLIGLLGKNAVLMVEYSVQRKNLGMNIRQAAIEGAIARFRPYLDDIVCIYCRTSPLVAATGAGAIGNRTIGNAAVGGMLFGTFFGLILIPGLYYIFGTMAENVKMVKYQREKPLTEKKDIKYKK
jgi:HAE1 family hydrophobic/amphiphilic exporter-1